MVWLCRIMLLLVFSVFWGGLTFYTGFVVRISHDVLADPMDGGFITQRVTRLLQYLGVATVILMAVNNLQIQKQLTGYRRSLLILTGILAGSLFGLFLVHSSLDAVIDVANVEILDRDRFDQGHRYYNQLTTIEWLASLAYLAVTVVTWMKMDQLHNKSELQNQSEKSSMTI